MYRDHINRRPSPRTGAGQGSLPVSKLKKFQGHTHAPMTHTHEHMHITHYAAGRKPGNLEHLVSLHEHGHNHAAIEHAHIPHRETQREHENEAHIHDHSHPDES
jgi:hypothetical protein